MIILILAGKALKNFFQLAYGYLDSVPSLGFEKKSDLWLMFSLYTLLASILHYRMDYRSRSLVLNALEIDFSTIPIWNVNVT